jgi:hypothetical protein
MVCQGKNERRGKQRNKTNPPSTVPLQAYYCTPYLCLYNNSMPLRLTYIGNISCHIHIQYSRTRYCRVSVHYVITMPLHKLPRRNFFLLAQTSFCFQLDMHSSLEEAKSKSGLRPQQLAIPSSGGSHYYHGYTLVMDVYRLGLVHLVQG